MFKFPTTKTQQFKQNKVQTQDQLFNNFYPKVTLHGFRYLFESKTLTRKASWFVIITMTFLCSIGLFLDLVDDFLERKTVVDVINRYEENHSFPTLTICPYNTQSKLKLDNLPLAMTQMNYSKYEFLDLVRTITHPLKPPTLQPTSTGKAEVETNSTSQQFIKALKREGVDTYEKLLNLYNIGIKELIEDCVLPNEKRCCYYTEECTREDFEVLILLFFIPFSIASHSSCN